MLPEEKDGTWVEMVRWRGEANRRKHAAWTPRCFNRALQLQETTLSRQALMTMPINHTGAKKSKIGWNGSISSILISNSILWFLQGSYRILLLYQNEFTSFSWSEVLFHTLCIFCVGKLVWVESGLIYNFFKTSHFTVIMRFLSHTLVWGLWFLV